MHFNEQGPVTRPVPVFFAVLFFALCCPAQDSAWHTNDHARWHNLRLPPEGKAGFLQMVPERTGLRFTNVLDESAAAANRPS